MQVSPKNQIEASISWHVEYCSETESPLNLTRPGFESGQRISCLPSKSSSSLSLPARKAL